jgi:hypothetical protein
MVNVASYWTIANNVFIKDDLAGASTDRNALFVNSPSTYISNGIFANNIIAGTGYLHPVKLPDTKNVFTLFDYNIIIPVGTEIVSRGGSSLSLSQVQSLGFMTHGSTADPKFVNPLSDWHLQTGSPAINKGTSLGYTTDFDGKPVDAIPDIGVYESASTPVPVPEPAPPAPAAPPFTGKMIIYPDPVLDAVYIQSKDPISGTLILRISDFKGTIFLEKIFNGLMTNEKVPAVLKTGIYISSVLSGPTTIHIQKLIVRAK